MLHSTQKAPDCLGQQAHLPSICINRGFALKIHLDRKQCVPRTAEHRLESLLAATAVAVLVEASLPSKLSYLGLAPKLAYGAEVETTLVSVNLPKGEVSLAALEYVPAPALFLEPEFPDAPTAGDRGSRGDDNGGFFNLLPKTQAATGAMVALEQMQIPQPSMVVAMVPEESWRPGTPGRELEPPARSPTDASRGSGQGSLPRVGEGGGSSLPSWVMESASLIVAGGLAGVAGVYFLASRGNRTADADTSAGARRTSGPASPDAAGIPTAARPAATSDVPVEAPVQRGSYGAFDGNVEYSYDGPLPRPGTASRRWGPTQRPPSPPGPAPAAAGASRVPRAGPGPAQNGGRGLWSAAPSPGVSAGPNSSPPPYADDAAEYSDAYPPPGPYYGPPPPWWREAYSEYDWYGVPYGPPPPYRGPARGEPPADVDETAPGQASGPQDTYYYYYGAPGGYWGWDAARRRVSRPPYDVYDSQYAGYDPAAAPPLPPGPLPPPPPPPPQSRGFAGGRASPGLGRNPWAASEQADMEQESSGPLGPKVVAAAGVPSPSPTGSHSGIPAYAAQASEAQQAHLAQASEKEFSDLANVDAALAQLQAQIDQLQGGGAATSAAAAAAASGVPTATTPDEQERGGPMQGQRRPTTMGWRQQLQQEVEEQQSEGRRVEGRGPEATWLGSSERLEEGRHQMEEPYTSSLSVSPSADQEYERLLQMWREVHPEEGNSRPEPYSESKKNDTAVRGGSRGESNSGDKRLQQQQVDWSLDGQDPEPTAAADGALPQSPHEANSGAKNAGSSWNGVAAEPTSMATAIAASQKPGGTESGSGPVGWFTRMFWGIAGGDRSGGGGSHGPIAQQAEQQDGEKEEKAWQRPQSNTELAQEVLSRHEEHHRRQQDTIFSDSKQAHAQQQDQDEDKDEQEDQERRRPAAEVGATEQAHAGAALAAAVEAALHGQLSEQQKQPQQQQDQPKEDQSTTAPVSATTTDMTAVPDRSILAAAAQTPQFQRTAIPPGPSTTVVPLPPLAAAAPLPKKESIQQLKATSAAAADRAAETLARIRAMRAAAQAAGTRSGSGGRSYSGTNGSGNGSLAGKGTASRNGKGSSTEDRTGVAAAQVGEGAARGATLAADGVGGIQIAQSDVKTGPVGAPRGLAEVQ
ncbi:hypothetical protein Vretimale_4476 [Volvox reticuliferus]|uniref:Uncharacterized protein n=1 Tax=Volvox reticuliferus TaxID=1737510 RepID=A0A8J4C2D5_9CHLO|nr:hypothetical protein Vretifemale_3077 [Volvox reticuliferus]GIL99250.1 hypothetical protein Vretimale_4476 [Volvox reticuliferus]